MGDKRQAVSSIYDLPFTIQELLITCHLSLITEVVMTARLNVNIDHVATVRQARRAPEPSVVAAAMACEQAGADGITIHLRGDRRHIQDNDLNILRQVVTTYLNVEMAATEEMIGIALEV